MTNNPAAVGALILVPIVIAGSVAFIAIKATHFCHNAHKRCKKFFSWPRVERTKQRHSDVSASRADADSWYDLESTISREEENQVQISATTDTVKRIWHPHRSSRLTWSFGGSLVSRGLNHSESSRSVQTPLPVVACPERSRCLEEDLQDVLMPLGHLLRGHTGL
jgi:hypothetical protein